MQSVHSPFSISEANAPVWYVMRPKPGLGARAIPSVSAQIKSYNTNDAPAASLPPVTIYAPRYRQQVAPGRFRECYVFPDMCFIHATPDSLRHFFTLHPYQLFHVTDKSKDADTNLDEYGNPVHDTHMRLTARAIDALKRSLEAYGEDVRFFTAHELQHLKYTRPVLIVDGPLQGLTCRIKAIEGKRRVIVDLVEGSLSLVVVMPETHFQRI